VRAEVAVDDLPDQFAVDAARQRAVNHVVVVRVTVTLEVAAAEHHGMRVAVEPLDDPRARAVEVDANGLPAGAATDRRRRGV
jgi:hypothetical protein